MSRKSYPNVNAANQYARDVVRGKIVACQFVIQACQRHLDDLMAEKSKSFRYRFDKDLAERAAKFIQLLPHTKGEWAFKRMPITLEPWQLFVICCAFGWVNKGSRLRRFREVYTEIPRKNGKSAISAGVALYCFACDTSGRWSYARQLYGHVYTAKIGTLSELVTAGDQFNQQHITLAGYEKDTQTPADELAASRTARAAVFIRNDPARPTQTGELVGMLPAPKGKRFTMTEQQTLLSHGVATAYVESGVLRIQRDVTTYRKNAYGVADNSYLDSETLHTSAYVLRKLKSVITSKYGRHKLASDGTRFGPGQAIVTPAVIKGELLATYRQLERAGIVENYELFKQYLVVERDASDPNRLNTLFPPDYVNQLRVFAVVNQFRLQYSEESA
ncbi:terminase large subunit domain-containing protein [Escherichia coli]|uniref:terminase large subunit domain-containing protein n=1 Tax=Escherichia coli TaxID=562 RepID=UPI00203D0FC7|nr:terminase large subunit [Escherichia coli]MCY6516767.1 terminase large subunit [Escherichia coli]MCY6745339.1 terminase large subunit [Escherichia coli]